MSGLNENINMSCDEINGHVKIEKIDTNGNVIYESSGKNTIKQSVIDYLRQKMLSAVTAWNPSQPRNESVYTTLSELFRYVYLVNSSDFDMTGITPTPTSEPYFPKDGANHIGYCDRYNQTIGANTKIGIIKYEESYCTPNSAIFVYEWSPTKAVGSFDTVIHASVDETSIPGVAATRQSDNVDINAITVPAGSNNAVWKNNRPTVYCLYKNQSNEIVICHTPVLSGVNLNYTEVNLKTGVSTTQSITTWNNAMSGVTPETMYIYFDGATGNKAMLFQQLSGGATPNNKIVKFTSSTWQTPVSITVSNICGSYIDSNYVYIKEFNNSVLRRYTHTGVASGSVLTSNMYAFIHDNKVFDGQGASYYDLSSATWSGEQLTHVRHKYGYPSIVNLAYKVFDGYIYVFESFVTYVTGENNGNLSTSYALTKYPITKYKPVETAQYRNGQTITKNSSETLRITYTFSWA